MNLQALISQASMAARDLGTGQETTMLMLLESLVLVNERTKDPGNNLSLFPSENTSDELRSFAATGGIELLERRLGYQSSVRELLGASLIPTSLRQLFSIAREIVRGGLALEAARSVIGAAIDGDRSAKHLPSQEATSFAINLLAPKKGEVLYVPWEFSVPFALDAACKGVSTEVEIRSQNLAVALRLTAELGNLPLKVVISDPLRGSSGQLELIARKQFGVAAASVPIGRMRSDEILPPHVLEYLPEPTLYGEAIALAHVLTVVERRAVVIVPNSLLFRTAGREKVFKGKLVHSGLIETVLTVPPRAWTSSGAAFSLLVLDKQRNSKDVLFVQASSDDFILENQAAPRRGVPVEIDWQRIIKIVAERSTTTHSYLAMVDEISKNEFNLEPGRYVQSGAISLSSAFDDSVEMVSLEDIAELIRPLSNRAQDGAEFECLEVGVADIDKDDTIRSPDKMVALSTKDKQRHLLRAGDILVVAKGSAGKVAMVTDDITQPLVANQSFLVVRINPSSGIKPEALLRYLASPRVQACMRGLVSGTAIPMLQVRDLAKLAVPKLASQEQDRICSTQQELRRLSNELRTLEGAIQELKLRHWDQPK